MKRLRTLLGIGLGLAVVAGAGWYISQTGTTSPSAARQGRFAAGAATPVGIATAAKGEIPVVVRALGTVTPLNTVNVKTQITGQLIKVEFKEGQMVKQGDLLAVVDPRPYDVALQQAIGTMQKDEALLKNAQIDLERYKKLVAQDSIARQQYDTQISLVRQYEAALVIDQAQVDAAKLNVTYTKILAPLTGRIGLRSVDQGNYVTMGDATSICIIIQVQPISVIFTIPEDSLPQVRQRLKAGATARSARARSGAEDRARRRQARHPRQRHRHDDRHGQAARHVRQQGRGPVSQPVRQRPAAGRHGQGRHGGSRRRHPARPARHLRLSR